MKQSADYQDFTVVLPIKDTQEEREFASKSLAGIVKLNPGEILIAIDAPANQDFVDSLRKIIAANKYPEEHLTILQVPRDPNWNFQLAHVCWEAYRSARFDKIFATNNDSIVIPKTVLKGHNKIGSDGIAVYSFTLGLRLKNISDLIRYIFYRYRVWMSDYVFAGNYWIYRPHFNEIVEEATYRSITNGVDTYLTQQINEVKTQYKVYTDKAIGVRCMTVQNEDYPWRQFQVGVWLGANKRMWASENAKRRLSFSQILQKAREKPSRIPGYILYYTLKLPTLKLMNSPERYVWGRSFIYQHPWMMKGFRWALANPDNEVVKIAQTMEAYDFYYQGGKYIKTLGIVPMEGTGA